MRTSSIGSRANPAAGGYRRMLSRTTISVYGSCARSATAGARPRSTRDTSSTSFSSTSGCCDSRYHVHVSAIAVVSCPARNSVIISSWSWRSDIPLPLSSSVAASSTDSRSAGFSLEARCAATNESSSASSRASARFCRRLRRVGTHDGSRRILFRRSLAASSTAIISPPTSFASRVTSAPNSVCTTIASVNLAISS